MLLIHLETLKFKIHIQNLIETILLICGVWQYLCSDPFG